MLRCFIFEALNISLCFEVAIGMGVWFGFVIDLFLFAWSLVISLCNGGDFDGEAACIGIVSYVVFICAVRVSRGVLKDSGVFDHSHKPYYFSWYARSVGVPWGGIFEDVVNSNNCVCEGLGSGWGL